MSWMRDSTSSSSMPLMSDGKGKARLRFSDPTDCRVKEAPWDWEFYFLVWMRTGTLFALRSSKAFWPSSCFVNNHPDWLTLSARRRWILNSIPGLISLPDTDSNHVFTNLSDWHAAFGGRTCVWVSANFVVIILSRLLSLSKWRCQDKPNWFFMVF